MLGEDNNLKDTSKDSIKDPEQKSLSSYGAGTLNVANVLPYNKISKLITALYMVTDTMEKEEPIRLKLRTLGVEIISDINSLPKGTFGNLNEKITTILSFLNIAFDIGMISEMNCNILKKEFTELKRSIQEFTTQNHLWFEEFILHSSENESPTFNKQTKIQPPINNMSVNKRQSTRIGVQKGGTLLKALSNRVSIMSDKNNPVSYAPPGRNHLGFELLKQQRRESILKIIKNKPEGISIKDIVSAIRNFGEEIGEKTLQRELVSMVKDNVLKKTGEKRWSQYFIN
ncbi:MAG: winged-helix domain-containing protein [Candidatus Paceibacterota bacterium]